MDINDLKQVTDRLDARTYESKKDIEGIYKRVDFIESRIKEIHTWIKDIRTRYADEGQVDKVLDAVKGVQRSVDRLR